jgi:hypothetical protein
VVHDCRVSLLYAIWGGGRTFQTAGGAGGAVVACEVDDGAADEAGEVGGEEVGGGRCVEADEVWDTGGGEFDAWGRVGGVEDVDE